MKTPDAILMADIHLRESIPTCRTDDFLKAQENKMKWLREIHTKYKKPPILVAGDLFDHWKPSPWLLKFALDNLPDKMIVVPGNHDLPAHNLELYDKSGLAVLEAAGKIRVFREECYSEWVNDFQMVPFPWGVEVGSVSPFENRAVAVAHIFTYIGRRPWPGCMAPGAEKLLGMMEGFDLIVTGDNHKPFVLKQKGRLLVNPGSFMRTSADQVDHEPRIYLWYADENRVEPIFIPIAEEVVSREHIERVGQRDERLDAFVNSLSGEFEVGLSFRKNLEKFFDSNRVSPGTKDLVWWALQ